MQVELSTQQQFFVKEYVVDFNGTRAAIAAGYSEKSAKVTASRLLTQANVQQALCVEIEKRASRCEVEADHVLKRLIEIDEMDIIDILNDNGTVKPISRWPKVWRQFLSGMDVSELKGNENEVGFLKKIKWPDKLKNLELIGKHLGMWTEKKDHQHKHSFQNPDGSPVSYKVVTNYVSPGDVGK